MFIEMVRSFTATDLLTDVSPKTMDEDIENNTTTAHDLLLTVQSKADEMLAICNPLDSTYRTKQQPMILGTCGPTLC